MEQIQSHALPTSNGIKLYAFTLLALLLSSSVNAQTDSTNTDRKICMEGKIDFGVKKDNEHTLAYCKIAEYVKWKPKSDIEIMVGPYGKVYHDLSAEIGASIIILFGQKDH